MSNTEGRIDLALNAIRQKRVKGPTRAAKLYNVPKSTIRERIQDRCTCRAPCL